MHVKDVRLSPETLTLLFQHVVRNNTSDAFCSLKSVRIEVINMDSMLKSGVQVVCRSLACRSALVSLIALQDFMNRI